ncbi:MAG TPA: hypothetical protein PLL76_04610 [Thermoanaerobaculia bacterium]|nr:hypothetical protein [Thermoanaerobaculia bacterium]HQP85520.1 hypothetical protein [Thermoanaerobaculia bacterium]
MRRVLFVEGSDEPALRALAMPLAGPWRLLARPEQRLFLLEATDPPPDLERKAASRPGLRAWTFEVVDARPSD